ncbi:ABC transporter substrate-binding protein [Thermodesulfobacteriota bacterium]
MKRSMYCLILVAVAVFLFIGAAVSAPMKPTTVAEIALYQGPDREQMLVEGAKKEGKLTFYTAGVMQAARPIFTAFQKKYPFIKVKVWRGGTNQLVPRVAEEYQARKYAVDVIEISQTGEIVFRESGISQPFYSPNLADIEAGALQKASGGGTFKAGHYIAALSLAFNKTLITEEQLPKTYQDLLDPKWKGKIPITSSNTGIFWVGNALEHFGEDFVKRLAEQKLVLHAMSGRALTDMIVAGEYAFSPCLSDAHVAKSREKGAPVDWRPLEPVPCFLMQMVLPKHPLNPHAAMLYMDFDLSRKAALLYKGSGYKPTHKGIPAERDFKKYYGPYSSKTIKKWNDIFNTLFMKR